MDKAARRIIDVEAHFYTPGYIRYLRARDRAPREVVQGDAISVYLEPTVPEFVQTRGLRVENALLDMGDGRIAAMDAAGVDMQFLSISPPSCEQFEPGEGARIAREANDQLAEVIARRPGRFAGLAALAPDPDRPEEAADELERAVTKLGFRGLKLTSHILDTYPDDRRYLPLFERAAGLGVPVYLHPTLPHAMMLTPYMGYGWNLPGPGLGFGAETALAAVRLIYSGLFDRFPHLQLILGHLGEALYFWLYRLDFEFTRPWVRREALAGLQRRPSEYLRQNFYVTISGNFLTSAFLSTMSELGADRLLFASDYPFEGMDAAVAFMEQLPIPAAEKEKVYGENAARLFGL